MFLSDLSIKRPIFAAVMMLALVTLGAFSYKRLAVDMFPDVEIPVVTIVTKFPGASPESVEREVSKKIEEAVNPIAGVKKVISISRESVSTVMVQFQLEVKLNDGAQEARAKIAAIRGELPEGIEEPIIQKLDFAAAPIVSLAVRSDTLPSKDLTTLVEKKVKRRFENIPGVGKVDLVGSSKREVNVDIDQARLEALGMGVDEVIAGIRSENVNTPLGRLTKNGSEFPLRVSGKPVEVSRFPSMVIGQRNGRAVLLGEVADVVDGIEEPRSLALVNGVPAIALDIQKQSGANTVSVVELVKKEIGRLQPELPPGTRIEIVRDASTMIRDSVEDVQTTLVLGGILTIFIVFCFLNSWRSTVITGLTLPISVISSFIVMNFMGMTLNVMTLMALSLAIGLLIDDAIVVRENIVRHLEHGQDHFEAARAGTAEIGLAVIATTFSIVAVFVPVAFMKGIVGRFFFQFGITVAFAVLVSLFVSFTLDPMLSSRWVDPDIERKGKRHLVARILDRFNGVVRPDGRPVSVRDRVGPRPSQDDARHRDAGVHRGHRCVRLAEDGVLHGGGPGRVPDQLQVRPGRLPRRDAGPRRGRPRGNPQDPRSPQHLRDHRGRGRGDGPGRHGVREALRKDGSGSGARTRYRRRCGDGSGRSRRSSPRSSRWDGSPGRSR